MSVIEINSDEEFEEQVANLAGPCVLDFYTQWCPPCKRLAPIFEEVSERFDNVKFFKIDAESAPQTAEMFGVMSVPTFVSYRGKTLESINGAVPSSVIERLANKALQEKNQ